MASMIGTQRMGGLRKSDCIGCSRMSGSGCRRRRLSAGRSSRDGLINEHNDIVDVPAFSAKPWLCDRSDVADRISTLLITYECICLVKKGHTHA